MSNDRPLILYAGSYALEADARSDFELIKEAHWAGLIGKYESALFAKDDDGKVNVLNTDSTTRTSGAKWGAATGAVLGLLFPPSLLAGLVWGTGIGTLVGHVAKGWGHKDIKELGEALDVGQSGIVLVAESTLDVAADRILKNAAKVVNREITDDEKEIRKALES